MTRPHCTRQRKSRQRSVDKAAAAPSMPPGRWLKAAMLLLTAGCLFGLFSPAVSDTDFWWHLKTGQYIAEHHSLPFPDPVRLYDSPHACRAGRRTVRRFNLTHEWLSQVLMYAVYAIGGFAGIVITRAVLLAGLCGWQASSPPGCRRVSTRESRRHAPQPRWPRPSRRTVPASSASSASPCS